MVLGETACATRRNVDPIEALVEFAKAHGVTQIFIGHSQREGVEPKVCVVDEFPHTNAPGVENEKRWQDVLLLLDEGIDVLTTMNIQYLESLNDQMTQITRIRVREIIPDWVMKQADEVIMVDVTPRALLNRLERGVVYSPEKAQAAMRNFFQEPTLVL